LSQEYVVDTLHKGDTEHDDDDDDDDNNNNNNNINEAKVRKFVLSILGWLRYDG
jgi:hypothetical protein